MTQLGTTPTRSEVREYCILLATVSIGTTALACAQIGPLGYHPVTAFPIFIVSFSSLITAVTLGVPVEYRNGQSVRHLSWAFKHGTGVLAASVMTCYAFVASVFGFGKIAFH